MIGQNDIADEVFTLADAKGFNQFAVARNVGRMSMWSANRDVACGSNYVDTKVVSDSCSGVKEAKFSFTSALSAGFEGSLTRSAGVVTKSDADASIQKADDPASSPYQIWSPTGAYLQGTKVVWHHNVYRAKWWTQDNVPDDPVLQSWETPWELVGPVLPGEKPVPQATVAEGTYPNWSGTDVYDTGQRVLFKGMPYKAKWWNQGQSPAAASSNANSSPWAPLTQIEINELNR
jgi:chitinase